MEGVRSWDTDHDVLIITDVTSDRFGDAYLEILKEHGGGALLAEARRGGLELASIEVKNLKVATVAALEGHLHKNRLKADRDGVRYNALVVKRKAGRGVQTPPLLVIRLDEFDGR